MSNVVKDGSAVELAPQAFLEPLNTRVVVKPDEFKYSGRLIIPERNQSTPTTGRVVAVGPLADAVKVGDRVVYSLYGGTLVKVEGKPAFRVLQQEEILCRITIDDALEYTAA